MTHPPGTVGVLSGDLTRYAWAMASLRHLLLPPGSQLTWVTGNWVSVAVNRIIASLRPEDAWVCLLTDDNPCEPDMLLRLLDHGVPLVAPLVCLRMAVFSPGRGKSLRGSRDSCRSIPLAGRVWSSGVR